MNFIKCHTIALFFLIINPLKAEERAAMNELQIFKNPDFGQVRVIEQDGEPWFIGKDIAEILGYSKTRNAIATHVDEFDKALAPIQGGCSTGTQNTTIINESGLYSLILSSKLPTAKQFKRWVTSEILPSIRKNGTYSGHRQGRKALLTDDCVEAEIERLTTSPEVRLARQEQRLKYKRRQYVYQLRNLEKRGRELMAQGVTTENMEQMLFGVEGEESEVEGSI